MKERRLISYFLIKENNLSPFPEEQWKQAGEDFRNALGRTAEMNTLSGVQLRVKARIQMERISRRSQEEK